MVGEHLQEGGLNYNYKVYLTGEVNAFAMADGTIRIYSGLMDLLGDGELRFVIGHEMGHIALRHIHKKMKLAYASKAIRKGIAATEGNAGEIARSQLGGLVELLTGAQFSQLEEKEADDYGLALMKSRNYNPEDAVSALEKLATLGNDHSFLASHPAPGRRAKRLKMQLAGKDTSIEEKKQNLLKGITAFAAKIYGKLKTLLRWLQGLF